MLKIMRNNIDLYINQYESENGFSIDYYSETSQFHPMAAAKYILTLCSLYRTKLLSHSNLTKKTTITINQLNQCKIELTKKDDMCFWGLNFKYKSYKRDEIYLITSAIVTQSLCELGSLITEDALLNSVIKKAMNGLEYWTNKETIYCETFKFNIPLYSKCNNEHIFNASTYAYAIIIKYSDNKEVKDSAYRYMDKLYEYRIPNIGWIYTPISNAVDLLHNSYIQNSYFLNKKYSDNINIDESINIICQFTNNSTFFDALAIKQNYNEWRGGIRRSLNKEYIELTSKNARLWSLGELIVVLANLNINRNDLILEKFSRSIVSNIMLLDFPEEKKYFRHTMHFTHGLALFLEMLRSK